MEQKREKLKKIMWFFLKNISEDRGFDSGMINSTVRAIDRL